MHTNLKPADCPDAALPAPIPGFEDKIFNRINVGFPEGKIINPDLVFDAVRAIRNALIKQTLAEAAREKAESANNAKSDFLMNMSHEIRTPIGAIVGLGHILLSTKLDDKQREYVAVLQKSAEALLAMVNRTLDAGKIESGTINPQNAPFDMAALLEQIVGIMSIKAQEKNIGLTLLYEAGAARTFVGDSGHIRQIVMNLVGNAIKFTSVGEVTVSFATYGHDISLSVADTGIGIAKDKIDAVFDRFVQADSSIGRKYGGTGLGLSISRALAENMGGAITVNSVAGKGSTFVLNLRLPADAGDESELRYQENVIYLDAVVNAAKPLLNLQNS